MRTCFLRIKLNELFEDVVLFLLFSPGLTGDFFPFKMLLAADQTALMSFEFFVSIENVLDSLLKSVDSSCKDVSMLLNPRRQIGGHLVSDIYPE